MQKQSGAVSGIFAAIGAVFCAAPIFYATTVFCVATIFCATAGGQTIAPFAGGGLPNNIAGASASLGSLGGQTGYSIGNISGALGRAAVDSAGNVYFVAFNSVLEWNAASGQVTVVAGNGTVGFSGDGASAINAQLNNPFAVAVDSSGSLYITDTGNLRVRRVTSGIITTIAGNGTPGSGGDGGSATQAQFFQLTGIAVDSGGSVYVADQGTNKVRKISGGVINTMAGGGGTLGDNSLAIAAMLNEPMGIAVDSLGALYIADRLNNRIRKVSGGIITTVAGNGTAGSTGDGAAATSAEISGPTDVFVVSATEFYIADTGNYRIRKVTGTTITAIAGNGTQGFSASGTALSAKFFQPSSIAVDASGNLYISDPGNNRISKVAAGNISVVVGGGASIGDGATATAAQLGYPSNVAIDSTGNIYIADPINQRVRKVSSNNITTVAGGGSATGDGGTATSALLLEPQAVALDSSGNLYIADTAASKIRKVSGGVITTVAGSGAFGFSGDGGLATSAALGSPIGLAVDASGNIFIADYYSGSGRIREVTSGGAITTVAGGGSSLSDGVAATTALISPTGVAVDGSGNLYIADQQNHKIRKVTSGTITTVAGNGTVAFSGDNGAATSAGMGPVGLAVDSVGNLYIADLFNNRVRKVTGGTITTIAGTGAGAFNGDGAAATASQLDAPEAVAVDLTGNVYIADTGNNRVRVVNSSSSSCAYATNPTTISASAAGGTFPVTLTTGLGCAWSVTGLPAWIAIAGASSGTGSSTVTLVVTANTSGAQSATVSIGSATVQVTQAAAAACVYTLTPNSLTPTSAGGTFPINIDTTVSCAWSVSNLPSWITISGVTSGTGAGTVTLVVAANSGAPRSVIVTIATAQFAVNQQNAAGATCTYSLSAGGQAFGASGGSGTFTVTALAGCTWTATPSASWITTTSAGSGGGTVSFQVAANTGAARAGSIAVLGTVFAVEQGTSSISGFTNAGSMPDLTVAGGWATSITLVNPSAAATSMRLNFFDDNGNPLVMPLTFPQNASAAGPLMASSIDRTLAPGAMLEIGSTGPLSQTTATGWAQLLSSGIANGFAKFRFTVGNLDHQALIPLENRGGTQFVIAYDNTGGFADGIAIANTTSQSVNIGIVIRNDAGVVLYSSTLGLLAMGGSSFVLPTNYAFTANSRGTVELDASAPGLISILGIEYNTNTGGFSTIPALIKQ